MTNIVPFSKTDHADLKVKPLENLFEYRDRFLLPICGAELAVICRSAPIVISKDDSSEPGYGLSMLCSLGTGFDNVWVTPEGSWLTGYVPAIIRQQPFHVVKSDDNNGAFCIDLDSSMVGKEGADLIEGGEPTEFLQQQIKLVETTFESNRNTQAALAVIDQLDLIAPFDLRVANPDGQEFATDRDLIYRIKEEKYLNLDDEAWLKLRHGGAIDLIYAHLFSLGLLQKLGDIYKLKMESSSLDLGPDDHFLESSETGDDNLSFDNLELKIDV